MLCCSSSSSSALHSANVASSFYLFIFSFLSFFLPPWARIHLDIRRGLNTSERLESMPTPVHHVGYEARCQLPPTRWSDVIRGSKAPRSSSQLLPCSGFVLCFSSGNGLAEVSHLQMPLHSSWKSIASLPSHRLHIVSLPFGRVGPSRSRSGECTGPSDAFHWQEKQLRLLGASSCWFPSVGGSSTAEPPLIRTSLLSSAEVMPGAGLGSKPASALFCHSQ